MGCFQTGLTGRSAAGTSVDPVTRSLRFDGSTSKLTRTPSSASSATACTISFWVKRGKADEENTVFHAGTADGDRGHVRFNSNNTLEVACYNGSWFVELKTNAVYRDPGAFYHICASIDTTNGTGKLFVNGEEPSLQTNTTNSSSTVLPFGKTIEHQIGQRGYDSTGYHYGLVSDFYFIDGTALSTPVGNLIEDTGYSSYKPKEYTGTFGFNGFHIDAQPSNSADLLIQSAHNESSTVFSDSANGIVITESGNARHSIFRHSPFASDERSIYFDGINDYIKVGSGSSDFAFGTGDYTIEGWFNFSSLSGVKTFCDLRPHNSIDNNRTFFGTDGSGLYMYLGGSNTTLAASGSLTTSRWHHIAFVRSSGTLKTYIDGELKTSITSSTDHSTDGTPHLGSTARYDVYGNVNHEAFLQGYVYDFRIINGTAAYTGEFTPPSGKLTATGGSYPSTTNVNTSITSSHTKLLIQPDTNDSSLADETSNNSITVTGPTFTHASGPHEQDTKSSSIYFDGTGDYLQTATSSDLTFGTGSFTVELWCMPYTVNTSGSYKGIISDEVYADIGGWGVLQRDDELSLYIKNTSGGWVSFVADGALTAYQWQHIAVSYDSSNTTTRLFVDGTVVASGTTSDWNLTGGRVEVGRSTSSSFFNGHAYDVRVTKGSALYTAAFDTPTAPFQIEPTFIGADQSGNKNHFEPTNISGHDILLDTPTKNYATLNPLQKAGTNGSDPSEGNLSLTGGSNPSKAFSSTIAVNSGKYYAEFYLESLGYPSVSVSDTSLWVNNYGSGRVEGNGSITYDVRAATGSGDYFINATSGSGALSLTPSAGDIIQVAFDADTRKVWFGKNGTWNGSGDPANGTNHVGVAGGTDALTIVLRSESETTIASFGQDPTFANNKTSGQDTSQGEFFYAPPTGFKSLNTSNLAAPLVTPANHFNTVLYTGSYDFYHSTGTATQSITGVGFSPDIVWIKDRDNLSNDDIGNSYSGHYWFDTVLGTGSPVNIDQEQYLSGGSLNSGEDGLTSFDSDGFSIDEAEETNAALDSSWNGGSPDTFERYVAWCWKLGTTASSWSGSGQDPDSEQYNSAAGVSIINYTDGNYAGTSITLNHSLGYAPEFAIWLDYDGNYNQNFTWHKDLSANNFLYIDGDAAQSSDSTYFPSGLATNTTFEVGSAIADGQQSHVALFRSVENFSKFGKYTGNGSSGDAAPFIHTGFRPAFVLIKRINSSDHWCLYDTARFPSNPIGTRLEADTADDEVSASTINIDVLSNGFKLRGAGSTINANNSTYIYASFAESPLKHANAK
jgi:hypothetical protein